MQENLNGFSRYYNGLDGAVLGFASLYEYDGETEAKESRLIEKGEDVVGVDGEMLVAYVWRKYGGDAR
jgi:hypothetical protein